jgi:hypothetical protein
MLRRLQKHLFLAGAVDRLPVNGPVSAVVGRPDELPAIGRPYREPSMAAARRRTAGHSEPNYCG